MGTLSQREVGEQRYSAAMKEEVNLELALSLGP